MNGLLGLALAFIYIPNTSLYSCHMSQDSKDEVKGKILVSTAPKIDDSEESDVPKEEERSATINQKFDEVIEEW